MPANITDESLWGKAKAEITKSYPKLTEEDEKFYQLVMDLYKKMGGKFEGKYIPDKELWWTVTLPGNVTDMHGTSVDFTEDWMQKIVNNTKKEIAKSNYPVINLDHIHEGEAYGMIDDVRFNGNGIEAKIAYLTNDGYSLISEGKYPYRSVEINTQNNAVVGCALTAHPAIKSMGVSTLKECEENKTVVYFCESTDEKNLLEVKMPKEKEEVVKDIKQPEIIDTPQTEEPTQLSFKETDEYKEYLELKKSSRLKDAKLEQLENEFKATQVTLEGEIKKRKHTEERSFCEKHRVPGYSSDDLAGLLVKIGDSQDKLEFSQGEKTVEKRPVEIVKDIIIRLSQQVDRYKEPIIDESKLEGKVLYSEDNQDNVIKFVEDYAIKNKLEFNEAYNECNRLNLIVHK